MLRLSDEVVHAGRTAHQQELAVELLGVGKHGHEHVRKEWPENKLGLLLLEQPFQLDRRFLRVAARIERDEFDLVGLIADLESTGLVDLVDRHRHTLGPHVSVDGIGTSLCFDLPDFDDVLAWAADDMAPRMAAMSQFSRCSALLYSSRTIIYRARIGSRRTCPFSVFF